jgi:hypothetical protein
MLLLFQNIAQQAKVYNILQHDCLVLLIMLQDLEGLWKQNEVSFNKDVTKFEGNYPIVFFFVNQGQGLKMHFKSSKFVQTKAPKA